ncbi:MAG: hypothetical protein DRJ44_05480 [Thermoprotei archaeon]|nr:MAG: hypothetical protein DRJ44_05480 [Thermoprotei archaeon]
MSRTIILLCAKEILEKLKIKAISLPAYHAPMGIRSMKRRRIVHSGLSIYFNDIIVAGEDVSSKSEAMDVLARKYNYSRKSCVLIDDKPVPINEVSMSGFSTIKIDSKFVLEKAWEEKCEPTLRVGSICELLNIFA